MEQLKNRFETDYKAYKDYQAYINKGKDKLDNDRKTFNEIAPQLERKEMIEKFCELDLEPKKNQHDFTVLTHNLANTFSIVESVIEIPKDIVKELKDLPKPHRYYHISDDNVTKVNEELHKTVKDNFIAQINLMDEK